ncbi:MAG: hypothetical protein KGL39_12655 [Patescibacteria group bacterium]|nr:hypothetical protein [Patescibacteria group bacterium]
MGQHIEVTLDLLNHCKFTLTITATTIGNCLSFLWQQVFDWDFGVINITGNLSGCPSGPPACQQYCCLSNWLGFDGDATGRQCRDGSNCDASPSPNCVLISPGSFCAPCDTMGAVDNGCGNCGGELGAPMAKTWTFRVLGVTDNPMAPCACCTGDPSCVCAQGPGMNIDRVTLKWTRYADSIGFCTFQQDVGSKVTGLQPCQQTPCGCWTLVCDGVNWILGNPGATHYTIPVGSFVCNGANVFSHDPDLRGVFGRCLWPATLTLVPG